MQSLCFLSENVQLRVQICDLTMATMCHSSLKTRIFNHLPCRPDLAMWPFTLPPNESQAEGAFFWHTIECASYKCVNASGQKWKWCSTAHGRGWWGNHFNMWSHWNISTSVFTAENDGSHVWSTMQIKLWTSHPLLQMKTHYNPYIALCFLLHAERSNKYDHVNQ